ncbi:hypothetical protein BC830DRAFT_1126167 [Chytriomyces sp. MP71]|nr:hypothetical protein BC830DRAFT_1126167 [Chytriomyces sp. MP71]
MSTFDGFIREIPSVKVDRFESSDASRRSGNVYFLSHAHQDHMKGLEFPAFASPVFCSGFGLSLKLVTPQLT